MLARGLALLFALCALLIGGCTDDEGSGGTTLSDVQGITRQIAGRWTGALHQKGLAPFKAAADIGADGNGHVAYTGIRCGGDWTLDEVHQPPPPDYLFREEITEGAGGHLQGYRHRDAVADPEQRAEQPRLQRAELQLHRRRRHQPWTASSDRHRPPDAALQGVRRAPVGLISRPRKAAADLE